ncbi:MAG TPA: hypothetical protein VFH45_05675 [Acidimicrobiales bacterium]|nr:hypothetical protein [Acidimicrobiales bacterium]
MICIDIGQRAGGGFVVALDGDGYSTRHEVGVPPDLAARLGLAGERVEALVRLSFEFLLEREPPTSILSRFDLDVIGRHFPGYESELADRLGRL